MKTINYNVHVPRGLLLVFSVATLTGCTYNITLQAPLQPHNCPGTHVNMPETTPAVTIEHPASGRRENIPQRSGPKITAKPSTKTTLEPGTRIQKKRPFSPPLATINQKVMRWDGPKGHVLLIERSNLSGELPANRVIAARIDWQFPEKENRTAIYKGQVFGNWQNKQPLATLHGGMTPRLRQTQKEVFTFTTPTTPGIYCIRMILNAQYIFPTDFSNYTHYRYDFVFRVGKSPNVLNKDWSYVNRKHGPHHHFLAIMRDNVSGKEFAPGTQIPVNIEWQIPMLENYSAIYKGNIFGNWDQNKEIAKIHSGGTPRRGRIQRDRFSFITPTQPGTYSLRFILNAKYRFATSYMGATHYFKDFVFSVKDDSRHSVKATN